LEGKYRIAELERQLKAALDENKRLKAIIATLECALSEMEQLKAEITALKKNSSNSSKPPSSDIVKPPQKQKSKGKRKTGAQKGHKQHLHKPIDKGQIDKTIELKLKDCPACGGNLRASNEKVKIHQQVELVDKPFIVTEFHQFSYWCDHCQLTHTAELPPDVKKAGLFGPKLMALTAYLKGCGHMSYKTIKTFYSDVMSINVSTGFLAKQVFKVSGALARPYQELLEKLPHQKHLHIDETGGTENGKKRWNWCFRGQEFTVFHINRSRGSIVLENLLGKHYTGIISCDFWGAYRKFSRLWPALLQFCWAHLIREVKYLSESPDKHVSRYAKRLLSAFQSMFSTSHRQGKI
jgi:transposase